MRQVVSVEIGGGPCRTDCPFYEANGWVRGVRGIPLKTHCRATMEAISVDCDVFNSMTVEKIQVTEAEWRAMQQAIGKKAKKERKPYDPNHEEIHAVGCEWTRRFSNNRSSLKNEIRTGASQPCGDKGKWNAEKSKNVRH
jgi:hypothetical protein